MFVNSDGTLSPYNQTQSYDIPPEKFHEEDLIEEIPSQKDESKPKQIVKKRSYTKKKIYLTFDDGPINGTQNVISILKEFGVDATMFMIGKHVKRDRTTKRLFLEAIKTPNILVANHTYSHANGSYRHFYSNKRGVLKDLNKMDHILSFYDPNKRKKFCRLAGRNVFRCKDLNRNDPAIKQKNEYKAYNLLKKSGFLIYGWDLQWSYNPKNAKLYKTPKEIVKRVEKLYKKGWTRKKNKLILLMHDFTFKSSLHGKEKLSELITLLEKRGWEFEKIDSY